MGICAPLYRSDVGGVFQTKVLRLLLFQVPATYSYAGLGVDFILSSHSVKNQCRKNTSLEEFQDRI